MLKRQHMWWWCNSSAAAHMTYVVSSDDSHVCFQATHNKESRKITKNTDYLRAPLAMLVACYLRIIRYAWLKSWSSLPHRAVMHQYIDFCCKYLFKASLLNTARLLNAKGAIHKILRTLLGGNSPNCFLANNSLSWPLRRVSTHPVVCF